VFFVATGDPSINAARIARRVMQGGHDVPIQKIILRHFRSIANCALVAREVDRLYLYDNSVDGKQAALVLRASNGKVIKQYCDMPEWMSPIAAQLNWL
jgi:predicted ABC-type ATPase